MELVRGTKCAKHPDQAAIALCDHCSNPLCAQCRKETVVTDEIFCSRSCKEEHASPRDRAADRDLIAGYQHPITTGWSLWARSIVALSSHLAPLALVIGLVGWLGSSVDDAGEEVFVGGVGIVVLLTFFFGIALTQVLLTQAYVELVRGNPYLWAVRRFLPWAATWVILMIAVFAGFIALIIPGIIIGLRLFWADEFALVHQAGPFTALKESWQLTRGSAGDIFKFQFLCGIVANLIFIAAGLVLAIFEFATTSLGQLEVVSKTLTFLVFFLGYAALHAPEIVYFYGMRAERARSVVESTKILNIS